MEAKGSAETDFSVVSYNILADCHMKPDWYDINCRDDYDDDDDDDDGDDDGGGLDYRKRMFIKSGNGYLTH